MADVIAIDGSSASGKGTIARQIAAYLDFAYLDTGLLYRATGVAVLAAGGDPSDPVAAEHAALRLDALRLMSGDDSEFRTAEAGNAASKVAAIPAVRTALLKFQRDFCATPPAGKKGAVLDGRDIGTVIAPEAKVKIFVTASPEARAQRRHKELTGRGQTLTYDVVFADLVTRDARDAERATAPTKPAPDAVLLDTTAINAEQSVAAALEIVKAKLA